MTDNGLLESAAVLVAPIEVLRPGVKKTPHQGSCHPCVPRHPVTYVAPTRLRRTDGGHGTTPSHRPRETLPATIFVHKLAQQGLHSSDLLQIGLADLLVVDAEVVEGLALRRVIKHRHQGRNVGAVDGATYKTEGFPERVRRIMPFQPRAAAPPLHHPADRRHLERLTGAQVGKENRVVLTHPWAGQEPRRPCG